MRPSVTSCQHPTLEGEHTDNGVARAFMDASDCATLRARAHSSAMPCSAAAIVFAVGALTTRQPT